ncbi:hypothetical protein [Corallococcus macrosporus]|nr:hypothetical protein [Corallococcus macrosporus]
MGLGDGAEDMTIGFVQLVIVLMYERASPKALWTGIVTTEFIRFAPAAVLITWAAVSNPSEVGDLLRSAFFWWPLRGLMSTAAFIWLCLKQDRPRSLAVPMLASLTVLGALSLWNSEPHFNGALPWRTDSLLHMLSREPRPIP